MLIRDGPPILRRRPCRLASKRADPTRKVGRAKVKGRDLAPHRGRTAFLSLVPVVPAEESDRRGGSRLADDMVHSPTGNRSCTEPLGVVGAMLARGGPTCRAVGATRPAWTRRRTRFSCPPAWRQAGGESSQNPSRWHSCASRRAQGLGRGKNCTWDEEG